MEKEFGDKGLAVVKIHSPEFDWEKERANVVKYAQKFQLTSPIYLDTDFAYWNALGNRYWPSFYLVDKKGNVRRAAVGEMHAGESDADGFEHLIASLLREPA